MDPSDGVDPDREYFIERDPQSSSVPSSSTTIFGVSLEDENAPPPAYFKLPQICKNL